MNLRVEGSLGHTKWLADIHAGSPSKSRPSVFNSIGSSYPPIITVGQPTTTPPWTVLSPIRAAGRPPIRTVAEPLAMTSGGPTQVAKSVARAAGRPPIKTVGHAGGRIGPPT